MIKIFRTAPNYLEKLHAWHKAATESNNHLFRRTEAELMQFASDRRLWVAEHSGQLIGMLYVTEDDSDFEIGGLFVHAENRKLKIGEVLFVFALSDLLLSEQPLALGKDVTFCVHENNLGPAEIAKVKFKFERANNVEVAHADCPTMDATRPGVIDGVSFRMQPAPTLEAIIEWWTDWPGTLSNGMHVELETLNLLSVEDMKVALSDIAENLVDLGTDGVIER